MFKYRFVCTNKDVVLDRINQIALNDLPCGKTLLGRNLYKSGLHIQQSDENIKGFYLSQSENESHRGSPIRVCFFGKFVENDGELFLDVYIYPRIVEVVLLMIVFIMFSLSGNVIGCIIAVAVICLFGKGYYNMIKEIHKRLYLIFT